MQQQGVPPQWGAVPNQGGYSQGPAYPMKASMRQRNWRGNPLCICGECSGSDCCTCLCVTCVPCIPFGDTVQRASGKGRIPAAIMFFFCLWAIPWIVHSGMMAGMEKCASDFPATAPPPLTPAQKNYFIMTGKVYPQQNLTLASATNATTVASAVGGKTGPVGDAVVASTAPAAAAATGDAVAAVSTGDGGGGSSPPPAAAGGGDNTNSPAAATARRALLAADSSAAAGGGGGGGGAAPAPAGSDGSASPPSNSTIAKLNPVGGVTDYDSCVAKRVSPLNFIILVFYWLILLVGAGHRLSTRKKFNIKNDCCGDLEDWVLWCCCYACALCQEHRTLVHHRVEDGVWPEDGEMAGLYQAAPAYGGYGGYGGYGSAPQQMPPPQAGGYGGQPYGQPPPQAGGYGGQPYGGQPPPPPPQQQQRKEGYEAGPPAGEYAPPPPPPPPAEENLSQ